MDYEKKHNEDIAMTTEEKVKAYDEALERAKKCLRAAGDVGTSIVTYIFPQLAESEDERMLRTIIRGFESWKGNGNVKFNNTDVDDILAYLEKQKESLHISETCKEKAKSFTDIIEVRSFQRGIEEGRRLEKQKEPEDVSATTMAPSCWEVEQKEQKPLITGNDFGWIDELKHDLKHPEELDEKVQEVLKKRQKPVGWSDTDNIGWDEAFACVTRAEKAAKNEEELQNAVTAEKWLKEIKFKYCVHPVKQEWSEEDEHRRTDAIYFLESAKSHYADTSEIEKTILWLKSLRPQPKQEWSEEDEKILDELLDHCNTENATWYNWLKSLRPSWKPSEEQMRVLKQVEDRVAMKDGYWEQVLDSLYLDLQKL